MANRTKSRPPQLRSGDPAWTAQVIEREGPPARMRIRAGGRSVAGVRLREQSAARGRGVSEGADSRVGHRRRQGQPASVPGDPAWSPGTRRLKPFPIAVKASVDASGTAGASCRGRSVEGRGGAHSPPRASYSAPGSRPPSALAWGPTIIGTESRVKPCGPGGQGAEGRRTTICVARPLVSARSARKSDLDHQPGPKLQVGLSLSTGSRRSEELRRAILPHQSSTEAGRGSRSPPLNTPH